MKKIGLCLILLLSTFFTFSQRKYKDTVMAGMCMRIDYDTTNTLASECIWYSPGAGQLGNGTLADTQYIPQFGPEFWLKNGWNGQVTLGNGQHKPVLVTLIQNGNAFSRPATIKPALDAFIASRFHQYAKDSAWHCMGFSAGGYVWSEFNSYMPTTGNHQYWQYFKSEVDLEGVKPDDTYDASLPYPQKFGNRAKFAKFALLGIDQIAGLGSSWQIQQNIIDSIPTAKVYNIWSDFGSGGHSNFNDMINPSTTDYTSTNTNLRSVNSGILSVFIAGGQNIFQWELRQGDSSLTPTPPPTIVAGTYSVTQANGFDLILNPTTTGSNLKYSWVYAGYYTSNDKVTHQTGTAGEPRALGVKAPTSRTPHIIQMSLYPGDSVHVYKIGVTVTDTVTSLSATDTAVITYHYWNRYPPQNTDGAAAHHTCTSGDSLSFGCSPTRGDQVITGANSDPVKDASGTTQFTSWIMFPTFPDSVHCNAGAHIYFHSNGNPYESIKMFYDTVGGTGINPLGLADTIASHQIIITYYGTGSLKTQQGFAFNNIRNVRITGAYDPVLKLGLAAYPGHANGYAYSDTLYGISCDNNYESIAGFGIAVDGKDSYAVEVDHVASIRGNFGGIYCKAEYANFLNPSTRSQLYWDYFKIHDNFVSGCHGEAYYIGSANLPAVRLRGFKIYNNRAVFTGNKLFKTIELYQHDSVYNNAGAFGSINFPSPFETSVSVGQEIGIIDNTNTIRNNLIYGFGNQGLNLFTSRQGITAAGTNNAIVNNAYLHSWGSIGTFVQQADSFFTIRMDSNYFGLHGPFLFGQIYPNTVSDGVNTNHSILTLTSGSFPGGGTLSTYNLNFNNIDSTKDTLIIGNGIYNKTGNSIIKQLAYPNFINTGFSQGVFPIQFVDSIFKMWGDEFNESGSTNQGTPMTYSGFQVVKWFDKFYQNRLGGTNQNFPTGVTDANWTLLTFSNGGTTPPNDIRLFSNDPYAQRNIGLQDQIFVNPGVNWKLEHRRVKTIFH